MINLRSLMPDWKIKALEIADDFNYSQETIEKIMSSKSEIECEQILQGARKHDDMWKRYEYHE